METSSFWLWLSLFLATGWALSSCYWWWRSRRAGTSPTAAEEPPSLRAARKRLRRACTDNDAAAARQALLAWGQAFYAPAAIANLHQLVQQAGDALGAEVARLNRSLYAGRQESWQGHSLWTLCQEIETVAGDSARESAAALLPLNPVS